MVDEKLEICSMPKRKYLNEHTRFWYLWHRQSEKALVPSYKTFFMLNSAEHEISTAHKNIKYRQMKTFLASSLSDVVFIMLINVKMPMIVSLSDVRFIMLINVKMPTIVGILTFMSRINFVLS